MTRRDLAAVAGIALVSALLFGTHRVARLDGFGIDSLFWLRHELVLAASSPTDAPVVVIAIDEETYRRDPFKDTPQVMWAPQQAKILDALLDGGPRWWATTSPIRPPSSVTYQALSAASCAACTGAPPTAGSC